MYNNPETAPVIKSTADTILSLDDKQPVAGVFERLQASAKELERRPGYFPAPQAFLSKLRGLNQNGVEELVRPHAEVSLTINYVRDTTFHRDHYNAATDSTIQNFNLDAWNIVDEYGDEGYALVADAVATAMDLTDGTLRLFVRLPAETSSEVAA
jgi:hypothetical protein